MLLQLPVPKHGTSFGVLPPSCTSFCLPEPPGQGCLTWAMLTGNDTFPSEPGDSLLSHSSLCRSSAPSSSPAFLQPRGFFPVPAGGSGVRYLCPRPTVPCNAAGRGAASSLVGSLPSVWGGTEESSPPLLPWELQTWLSRVGAF